MILLDVKKYLEIFDWGIKEFPGYILNFMSGVIDVKIGDKTHRQRIEYSLLQRGDSCYMTTSPHLLNTPGELKIDMIKNHIKLTSVTNSDDSITLIREVLK